MSAAELKRYSSGGRGRGRSSGSPSWRRQLLSGLAPQEGNEAATRFEDAEVLVKEVTLENLPWHTKPKWQMVAEERLLVQP
jgi:hypothetical protein